MKQSGLIISSDPLEANAETDADESADLGLDVETRVFRIEVGQHGQRLDVALVSLVPEFSRSYLQQLIEAGAVTIAGMQVVKPSSRVKVGSVGSLEMKPTPQSQAFKPESIPLDIVYCDDHLLVVNKPAGLVVHPAPGNWSGTLLNALLGFDPRAGALPRAGIVHRLDKNTSGLMVVARTRSTMDALVQMIAARVVSRQYLALTLQPWLGDAHRDVDAPIGRDPRNRLRMAVVDLSRNSGKEARTSLKVLYSNSNGTLVRCTLHTGRTHQIRVHMASIGLALVADELYGGKPLAPLERQALHACRLAFKHPVTQKELVFEAPLPPDLRGALASMELRYNEN